MKELRIVILAGVAYAGINLAVTYLLERQRGQAERIAELEAALHGR